MKIKIMLSVGLLVSTLSPDLQAMGGARDFARKLFISKTAAVAAITGLSLAAYIHYDNDRDSAENLEKYLEDPDLSPAVYKEVESIFKKDGIAIAIKGLTTESNCPAGVFSYKGKNFLYLSKESVRALNACGLENESSAYQLPFLTKDELLAMCEHEKSHLKNYDMEKNNFFYSMSVPGTIVAAKAARLLGASNGATVVLGLGCLAVCPFLRAALSRQYEKRADLSLSTSKAAWDTVRACEKFEGRGSSDVLSFQEQIRSLLNPHPSFSERVRYMSKHALQLEHKEQQAKNRKM